MSFVPIDLDNPLPIRVQQIKFSFISSHWHNSLELLYITDGACRQLSNGQEQVFQKGDLIVNNAMVAHELKADRECQLIAVQFPYLSLQKEYSRFCPDIEHLSFSITRQDRTKASYQKLCNLIINLHNDNEHWQDNLFSMCAASYEILQILTRHYKERPKGNGVYLQDDQSFLNILSYIQKSYKEKITREKIGLLFGYSPKYVSQLFSRKIHTSLQNFVNQLRLENAYNELLYSTKTITYIAEENGFSSLKYFNKCFKDAYHLTPKEFRSKYQHDDIASKRCYSEARLKSGYDILHLKEQLPEANLSPAVEGPGYVETRDFDFGKCQDFSAHVGTFLDCRNLDFIFHTLSWEHICQVQREGHYSYALVFIPPSIEDLAQQLFLACRQLQTVNLKPCFILSFSESSSAAYENVLYQMDRFISSYKGVEPFEGLWGIDVRQLSTEKQVKALFDYSQKYLDSMPGIVVTAHQLTFLDQVAGKSPFSLCYIYGEESLDQEGLQGKLRDLDVILAPPCQKTPLNTAMASLSMAMAILGKAKSLSLRLHFEDFEGNLASYYVSRFLAFFDACPIHRGGKSLIGYTGDLYLALDYERATKSSGYMENYGFKVYHIQAGTYCISTADLGTKNGNFVYNLNVQRDDPKISQYILSRADDLSRPVYTMKTAMMNTDDIIEMALSGQGIHFLVFRKYR